MDKWIGAPFEWLANAYAVALLVVGVGSIVATVVLALATGTWLLLLILVVPGIWLLMWLTD